MNESARLLDGRLRAALQPAIDGVQGLIDRAFFDSTDPMQKVYALTDDINEHYLSALVLRYYQAYESAFALRDETDNDKARIEATAYLANEIVSEAFRRYIIGGEEVPNQTRERGRQLIEQLKQVSLDSSCFSSIHEMPMTKTMAPMRLNEALANATPHQASFTRLQPAD